MKILICDDEEQYLEQIKAQVREYMSNRFIPCSIVCTVDSRTIINSNMSFDLALLDIQMPVDGLTLAKELKKRNRKIAIFFITNYDEYQDDAMDLQAFRFFEKPFNMERLYSSLDKALEYIDGAYVDFYLYKDGAQSRILVDDILYITRQNRRTIMVVKNGSYSTKESFDEWCERLPSLFFYQVHKSFFVNLHYVERYAYSELIMIDNSRIPVAPRKQASFHKFWFEYLRRR